MLLYFHNFFTLSVDVMFVNRNPFLVSMSHNIQMYTAEYLPPYFILIATLLDSKSLSYSSTGFFVRAVMIDLELKCLMDKPSLISFFLFDAHGHVTEIETTRVINKSERCMVI